MKSETLVFGSRPGAVGNGRTRGRRRATARSRARARARARRPSRTQASAAIRRGYSMLSDAERNRIRSLDTAARDHYAQLRGQGATPGRAMRAARTY